MIGAIPGARRTLTLTYLGIIMVISLGFSVALYEVSSHTIGFGLQSQERAYFVNGILVRPRSDRLRTIRDTEYDRVQHNLLLRLLFLNLGMLGVGAWFSDYLAKRSLQPLEQALESQARFTSDAAHELRTPLTAMKTEIEVGMRTSALTPADAKALLASNLEEVNKLDALTAALLRLAKQDAADDTWENIPLSSILAAATKRVGSFGKHKQITFRVSKTTEKIHGDKHQLIELFYVLFENAVKYGKPDTTVEVKTARHGQEIRVQVIDQGIGVSPKDLPHIFERFYRADQSRAREKAAGHTTEGTGLGLSLAQQIAHTHQGEITATSKPGKGSTFTVTLPVIDAAVAHR